MDSQRIALRVASNPKFSGNGGDSWEKWLSHFELRFHDVEKQQRGGILIDLLDGVALDECAKLSTKELQDYETIKKSLGDRFGGEIDTLQAYAELAQAKQEPGEEIEAFGDRIMGLVEKSFPNGSTVQKQEHGLKQFVCGLSNERLQEKLIARDEIGSLKAAIQVAKHFKVKENVLEAVRGKRTGEVVMAACQKGNSSRSREDDDRKTEWAEMKAQLVQIQSTIAQLEARVSGQGHSQGAQGATGASRSGRGCYHCGELTHFKRQCPQRAGNTRGVRQGVGGNITSDSRRRQPFCVACGREGHWMAECWRAQRGAEGAHASRTPRQSNQAEIAASFRDRQTDVPQGNE